MRIQQWLKKNELFSRIFLFVVVGVISVCLLTVIVIYGRSKDAYVASYQSSNRLLLDKIQEDYERLNENINRIFDVVDESKAVENYLKGQLNQGRTILELNEQLKDTRSLFQTIPSNLVLIGTNGRSFFQNDAVRNQSVETFLASKFTQQINENEAISQYYFLEQGLSTSTSHSPGLMYVRKLMKDDALFGYALIFLKESDFSSIYRQLLDTTLHTIYVVNDQGQILSSSEEQKLGTAFDPAMIEVKNDSVNQMPLYSYQFTFYDLLDESHLVRNMNLIKPAVLIAFLSILLFSLFAFWIIRTITQPIYQLIDKLPAVTQGDFSNKVSINGTYETQELGRAYNLMLEDLESYVDHLMITEAEKRKFEIRSLQMQIQPHFVYNTLTAIKFLIWQNEQEKATQAIDSFVQLLRHTFNRKEIVPLKDELAIVEEYLILMNVRYGDRIQSTIFSAEECENCLVPKMILQPIIENAYLHAFPEEEKGYIQIFSRISKSGLIIEIIDTGIGFDEASSLNKNQSIEHYSGIGLENIDQRIKLLYGEKYGLTVVSRVNEGTTVRLLLPNQ
ncbi:sensor histidine kinase [Enterococcus gallinarum]|uniref:Histidine kinase n=1 Tax=Enterococcus gallinarum TaxID=1353 RepID=A0ABD4ZPW8_ENTGA|nr:histidine kinase [Enterococcus gallinarum]MBF0725371.1 sensor histidine kinase [Enterococcus gallinarum]MBX8977773.1 sensor histidine kinase [Enterococcus gallinarum]MDL4934717.1 histidine kinase [Enterococcus gallinarum]NYS81472.1 sensor histidine kinase [Enterococcus gallinarum]